VLGSSWKYPYFLPPHRGYWNPVRAGGRSFVTSKTLKKCINSSLIGIFKGVGVLEKIPPITEVSILFGTTHSAKS